MTSPLDDEFALVERASIFNIVTEKFGYQKLCARLVPKMLTGTAQREKNIKCANGQLPTRWRLLLATRHVLLTTPPKPKND